MQRLSERHEVGPYRLLAVLGEGGMGRVCLAAGGDGRLVAVKQVREEFARDAGFRERFRHEVAASRRVSGAYTAAVIDADPDAPSPWLASAFVPGPVLSEAVGAAGPLPVDTVLRLAAGLASALVTIHAAGLVHRDLKPSNVLLAADGPRVIDFGIAHATDTDAQLTRQGWLVGAPAYMSPEQAAGRRVTAASDVFSLGCVLAVAATGADLFTGAAPAEILHRVLYADPDLTALPDRLRSLIAPCLAKDPARRPTPAQLRDLVGVIPPATHPWPPAIHELIAAQQADLADLLGTIPPPGAGPGATMIAPVLPQAPPPDPALRGVARVSAPSPEPQGIVEVHDPGARRSRSRVVFWVCAGVTAVVLLGTLLVGVGLALADHRHPAGASGTASTGSTPSAGPSPSAAPSSPAPHDLGPGLIQGYGGKCLDVHDADNADRSPVQIYTCNGTVAQEWTVGLDGTVRAMGKCLDVTDAGTANGTKVQLYTCNGTGAQQWHAQAGQLVNPASGRCLDDTDLSTTDGTQAQIWDCLGGANQQWRLPS